MRSHELDERVAGLWVGRGISVKRCHGLRELLYLLPVLDRVFAQGGRVHVVTRARWVLGLNALRPGFRWDMQERAGEDVVDMETLVGQVSTEVHQTDELGRLLRVAGPFEALSLRVPEEWSRPWGSLAGAVVFAPEAGVGSQAWPGELAAEWLGQAGRVVLVGKRRGRKMEAELDLRGRTGLIELIGLLAVVGVVVTMDSAVLQLAAAMGVSTVAVLGGVAARERVRPEQRVVAVQAGLGCCPCNGVEPCGGSDACVVGVRAGDVARAVARAREVEGLEVMRAHAAGAA